MRFLQPDPHLTYTLPCAPWKHYSEGLCFLSRHFLSVQRRSESSMHHVMAHARSSRRHPYSALSHGHGTWQGVAP